MDKLRPVLKQMFWICTGFVVLLAVGGWWMALGDLREQIQKGETKLNAAEKASNAGGNTASAAWTNAAKQVNAEDRQKFQAAEADLHQRQLRYRSYPEKIAPEFRQYRFGSRINDTALRGEYGKLYLTHFLEQLKVLNPFIVQENRGLIDVDVSQITQANPSSWPNQRPSSAELWKAQEDLWLLRSLFESINSANAGAQRLGKAPVRQLISLKLRGGKRVSGGSGGGSGSSKKSFGWGGGGGGGGAGFGGGGGAGGFGAGGAGGFGAFGGDSDDDRGGRGGGGGRPGRPSGRSTAHPGAGFEGSASDDLLAEEFGAEPGSGGIASSKSRGGGGKRRKEEKGWGSWGSRKKEEKKPEPTADSVESELTGRYVDDAAEYRTRAFQLQVKVHHAHIPVLLAELTNSSFPVEIVRVDASFETKGGSMPMGMASQTREGGKDRDRGGKGSGFRIMGGGGRRATRRGYGSSDLLSRLASPNPDPTLREQGESQLAAALADPALATVRIAGLMTIYRTKEENAAAKETELEDMNEKMQQAGGPAAAGDAEDAATTDETTSEDGSATDEANGDAEDSAAPAESGGGDESEAGAADTEEPAAEPEPPNEQNPLLSP